MQINAQITHLREGSISDYDDVTLTTFIKKWGYWLCMKCHEALILSSWPLSTALQAFVSVSYHLSDLLLAFLIFPVKCSSTADSILSKATHRRSIRELAVLSCVCFSNPLDWYGLDKDRLITSAVYSKSVGVTSDLMNPVAVNYLVNIVIYVQRLFSFLLYTSTFE